MYRRKRMATNFFATTNTVTAGRDHLAMQIPPFWSEEPTYWFIRLEAHFLLAGITDDYTKYAHVIASLDRKNIVEVTDILTNPPDTDRYEKIKSELIKRLSLAQEQPVRQKLKHEEMGDRTPSEFLRHLKQLAGRKLSEESLRSIWMRKIPSSIRVILATQADSSLQKAAELADKILETYPEEQSFVVAANLRMDALMQEIVLMKTQISELSHNLSSQESRGREVCPAQELPRARSNSESSSCSSTTRLSSNTCWYHAQYGNNAFKCVSPCNYKYE